MSPRSISARRRAARAVRRWSSTAVDVGDRRAAPAPTPPRTYAVAPDSGAGASARRRPAARRPRRRPGRADRRAAAGPARARPPACTSCSSNTSRVRRASASRTPGSQQRVALLQHPFEVDRAPRRSGRRASRAARRGYTRRVGGPPFTSARSSGANTVTRSKPCRSRARVHALAVAEDPVAPAARGSRPRRAAAGSPVRISARTIACSHPRARASASVTPRNDRARATHPIASSRLVLPCPFAPLQHREPGIELEVDRGADTGNRRARDVRHWWSSESAGSREHVGQEVRTGMSRYRKSSPSARVQRRRLQRIDRLEHDLVGVDRVDRRRAGTPG